MKRALTILVLLVSSRASEATNVECVDYFLFSNLNLSYCSRYCYRADTEMLYYKGLAEVLSTYIDRRREEGMLQAKKLGIKIDLIEGPFCPDYPQATALGRFNRTLDREVSQPDMGSSRGGVPWSSRWTT